MNRFLTTKNRAAVLTILAGVALSGCFFEGETTTSQEVATGNGRLEATEILVAAKGAGRIVEMRVDEGDWVDAKEVLARIDSETLISQLKQAKAQLEQAKTAVGSARAQLRLRQSEKAALEATLLQRKAELEAAKSRYERTLALSGEGAASKQEQEDTLARLLSAEAAVSAASAQIAAAEAAVTAARTQIVSAESSVEAAEAQVEYIQTLIRDNTLTAPRAGRVQYRIAQPGEVVGSGGRVVSLLDLSEVYMTFFLPTAQAGKVALGAEALIVLDAAPNYAIPAHISYVSDVAQFTPKTVETAKEREKLMFRIKARVDPDLLKRYTEQIKAGLPGRVWVKLKPEAPWPSELSDKARP
ncbi:MAG: HlyD family secretion protein [Campylobacterales bacterium]